MVAGDAHRFKLHADQQRAEADLVELVGNAIGSAQSFPDAGARLAAVAYAKREGAERLDEMAREAS